MKFSREYLTCAIQGFSSAKGITPIALSGNRTLKSSGNQSMRNSSLPKLSPKYQEKLDTRLKAVEEKAGQGISLMAINRYYGKKPEGYKSIFDNYMVLNLKRTQFHVYLQVIVFLFIASYAGLFWYLSKH